MGMNDVAYQAGAYCWYHQMAGAEVYRSGTEEIKSYKTQIRETSFIHMSPVLLAHVWVLSNA